MTTDDKELYEFNTHAFVIKIWLEDDWRWRGHITHVPSGKRSHIQALEEIDNFIFPFLARMGIQRSGMDNLCSLLRRRRSAHRRHGARRQRRLNPGEEA